MKILSCACAEKKTKRLKGFRFRILWVVFSDIMAVKRLKVSVPFLESVKSMHGPLVSANMWVISPYPELSRIRRRRKRRGTDRRSRRRRKRTEEKERKKQNEYKKND